MNQKLIAILTGIFISALSIATVSEAQTMKDESLNLKHQKIVPIAAFTANGDLQRLSMALNEGLDAGMTINEIKEVLIHLYAYAGFPRSLNGIATFMSVLDERAKKGVKDPLGKEASPLPAGKSSIELGTEIQTRLVGRPVTGAIYTFAPTIDQFLKGHLFGDIFGRDILDFQTREIATISALASIEGVNPQLQSHFSVGLNVGLTEGQMRSLISVLESKVGKKEGNNANEVLGSVLGNKQTKPTPGIPNDNERIISITRSGSQPSVRAPAEHFTGSARVDPLFRAQHPSRASGSFVTFEPGARTAWHSHPVGQTLIVTAGAGWIQQWGGPIQEIRQGDVVWFPPSVKHWHGATATTAMTHIAIGEHFDGKTVEWMEKVTDEQYGAKGKEQK
jgi:4-carboxymuconolactone decarboxylase